MPRTGYRVTVSLARPHKKTEEIPECQRSRRCAYHPMVCLRGHQRGLVVSITAGGFTCRLRRSGPWKTRESEPRRAEWSFDWSTLTWPRAKVMKGRPSFTRLSHGLEPHWRQVTTQSQIYFMPLFRFCELLHCKYIVGPFVVLNMRTISSGVLSPRRLVLVFKESCEDGGT